LVGVIMAGVQDISQALARRDDGNRGATWIKISGNAFSSDAKVCSLIPLHEPPRNPKKALTTFGHQPRCLLRRHIVDLSGTSWLCRWHSSNPSCWWPRRYGAPSCREICERLLSSQ
jgi:hypothetical protein